MEHKTANDLFEQHRGLARAKIRKYLGKGLSYYEVLQAAETGLYYGCVDAETKWDPERGALTTFLYAGRYIEKAISEAFDEKRLIKLPKGFRERVRAVKAAEEKLWQMNGKEPSREDIANETGLSIKQVDEVMRAREQTAPYWYSKTIDDETWDELDKIPSPEPDVSEIVGNKEILEQFIPISMKFDEKARSSTSLIKRQSRIKRIFSYHICCAYAFNKEQNFSAFIDIYKPKYTLPMWYDYIAASYYNSCGNIELIEELIATVDGGSTLTITPIETGGKTTPREYLRQEIIKNHAKVSEFMREKLSDGSRCV